MAANAQEARPWAQGPPQPGAEDDECSSELFQSDQFRLWCMKVIPCTKRFVHDWTICPFAHAGEKAVRRDPRLHSYTGIACPDMKKTGNCIRGEKCPYAHNVFEYWLHPTRYRTQLCNDGPTCRRGICFFAHSLEELRVPACKPYVSPEALARASLEAIQQNPHPLGQQLPNPVAAAAQQQAAMAAMGGPRQGGGGGGMRGGRGMQQHHHPDSAPSSLAPSATPFVPGGFHVPSGEPVRYSAPGGSVMAGSPDTGLPATFSMGAMGQMMGPPGSGLSTGEFGGSLPPQYVQAQHRQGYGGQQGGYGGQQGGYGGQQGGYGGQQGGYGGQQGGYGGQQGGYGGQQGGYGGQQRWSGGHRQQYGASMPAGNGMRSMPHHASRSAAGSAPAEGGVAMAGARLHQAGAGGGAGAYPSAPARVPSPAGGGGHKGYAGTFAALQQQPPQAFGSYTSTGDGQGGGSAHSGRSAPRSSGHASEEDEGEQRAALAPQGSGRASPAGAAAAGTDDLAQSLASLKIALTQQQLAAAAGSNHEVVISTLHQILKDAMAQQGGSAANSFGAPGGGDQAAVAAACAAAAAVAQQQLAGGAAGGAAAYCGSPNAAVGASFGSAPSVASSLTGSAPRYTLSPQDSEAAAAAAAIAAAEGKPCAMPAAAPPMSSSPDAVACYEAARVAAAGGYTGVLPLGGAGLQAVVPTPRTSGESSASGSGAADDLSAPAPVAEPQPL
ncbi:hypothetical protein ABPG75_002593 [Micractinium tetrahymenae]